MKPRHDALQTKSAVLDGKAQFAAGFFNSQIEQKRHQPVAGQIVVVLRQDFFDSGDVIGSRREIGAEQQEILSPDERRQPRQNFLRLEIGDYAEESDESHGRDAALRRPVGAARQPYHFSQIVRRRQIADEWKTIFLRHNGQRGFARDQNHRRADIAWRIKDFTAARFQQFQQPRVLLPAAAAEADDMNPLGPDFFRRSRKTLFVNHPAIRVVPRRRVSLMQRQPFLRLLDAVVVELVVHAPRAERFQQITTDSFWKLASVNRDVGGG